MQKNNTVEASQQQTINPKKVFEYVDALLSTYIQQHVDFFRFEPNQPLEVGKGDKTQKIEKIVIMPQVFDLIIRNIVGINLYKNYDAVLNEDIRIYLSGKLFYDINFKTDSGIVARNLTGSVYSIENNFGLILRLEPLFLLGYSPISDPSSLDDDSLEVWLENFCTRIMNKKNPTPKDIVFNPNKKHPYVTVTGGLRQIEDVVNSTGGILTERIARILIKAANNPVINKRIIENQSRIQGLDIDLAYKTSSSRRFRVNIADVFDAERDHAPLITMRLLADKPWSLDELPLPAIVLDTVCNTRMGLVLISGTTGSGKSTTMGVLIDFLLRKKSINFLTIEHPIEVMFPSKEYPQSIISQREIGKHAITFHSGVESAVRQTLNMAMVGEIRNAEDASIAMELAQAGHLIFATIHAGSVGESVTRIVEMYPSDQAKKVRDLLASQYKMGIAQILVRGVEGQTELVLEVMKTNSDIKKYISGQQDEDKQLSMRELIEYYSPQTGMMSLDQYLVKLFKEEKISEDTLMYNSPDPDALVYRQTKLGIKLSSRWDKVGAMIEKDMQEKLSMDTLHKEKLAMAMSMSKKNPAKK